MRRTGEPLWTAQVLNGESIVGNAGRFDNPRDVCDYMLSLGWMAIHSLPPGQSHVGWKFQHPTTGEIVRAGRQTFFRPALRTTLRRAPR
jgi:hypothetical protein